MIARIENSGDMLDNCGALLDSALLLLWLPTYFNRQGTSVSGVDFG